MSTYQLNIIDIHADRHACQYCTSRLLHIVHDKTSISHTYIQWASEYINLCCCYEIVAKQEIFEILLT